MYLENDTINLYLENALRCPLRYYIKSTDAGLQSKFKGLQPLTLSYNNDTLIKIFGTEAQLKTIKITVALGDPNTEISKSTLSLPFPMKQTYRVIQGYNGNYSHKDNYSKFAIDFNLKKGDTVCVADDGYVVGIVKDYEFGGDSKAWQDYANYITVYHPTSKLFTQYVHLQKDGVLVDVGDLIRMGDAIGLAGSTGWTNAEHLHFNVLVAAPKGIGANGLQSVPVDFQEGYKGIDLKVNTTVKKVLYE